MRRVKYVLGLAALNAAQLPVLFWFVAPYNSRGVDSYLPNKGFVTCLLGIAIILISGSHLRSAEPPPVTELPLFDKQVARSLQKLVQLTGLVALARFMVPLFSSKLGTFSSKLSPKECVVWGGLLFIACTLSKSLRLYMSGVVPTADEILAHDSRKPVLYFRSFNDELKKSGFAWILWKHVQSLRSQSSAYIFATSPGNTFYGGRSRAAAALGTRRSHFDEQMVFADALSAIGPYIALGRPMENFRNMDLGAAKKYVRNDEWQDQVRRWLWDCAAVVFEAADSDSLGWEIEQALRLVPPTRVLVICPHTEGEYQAFSRAYAHLFPLGLPETRPTGRLLIFDEAWQPRELENINLNATESLEPFFRQLGIEGA